MLQLELLWRLQCIDREINIIKKDVESKNSYKRLSEIKRDYGLLNTSLENGCRELEQNKKAIALLNVDLRVFDQKYKENNSKLYESDQNLKTIDNLQREISSYKEKIDETEDSILKLIEIGEKLNITIKERKEKLSIYKNDFNELKEQYTENSKKDKQSLEALNITRENIVKELDETLVKQYNDIACKKNNPVSAVIVGTCTECGVKLNAMLLDSVRKKNDICLCDYCNRILYID